MTDPLIRVRGLTKSYAMGEVEVRALDGVSLDVEPGEFVAVTGPSGSGKSTFMNLLGCLDRPSFGSYFLSGRDVSGLSSDARARIRNREIGFVFQGFNLMARTTAVENVELPLFYGDVPLGEQRRRAREALARVGLAGREKHLPSQLSGGQQQRVAIARALVGGPSLLLADEPTGNLDSQTSLEIVDVFRRLNLDQGMTIVLVTHEPDIARAAERVITFRDGVVAADERVTRMPRVLGRAS